MKVTVEHLPRRQALVSIEAEPKEMEHSRQEVYKHLVARARVPGFRSGKAPLAVVERHFGKAAFLDETLQHLVPELTQRALNENSLKAIGNPDVEISPNEPGKWKATIDLEPLVDLGAYRDLRILPDLIIVDPAEVDKTLEDVRFRTAPWEPVNRPSQADDLLIMDAYGEADGKKVVDEKGAQYQIVKGFDKPVPGFPEQVMGLVSGGEKEFTLSFPIGSEPKEFAGKDYLFRVKVQEVKGKTLPPLDDEFAKGVGEGKYETLAALREEIESQIRRRMEREAREAMREKALAKVAEVARLEYSPGLVQNEAEHVIEEQEERLRRNSVTMEGYLKSIGKTREQVLAEVKPAAEQRLVRSLVVAELKDREKIEVSDAEVDTEIETLVANSGENADQIGVIFRSPGGRASVKRNLLTRKTLDRLVDIVSQSSAGPVPGV